MPHVDKEVTVPFFQKIFKPCLLCFVSVYVSSLPVAHLSYAPRGRLLVTGDSAMVQDETTESTVTRDLGFNPFPNKPCFLRVCSTSHLKTLWEKEKLLITSNFSFSHSVFYLVEDFLQFSLN